MKKWKLIISWIAVLAVMCTIFYFSSQPAVESDETSGGFIAFLYNIYAGIAGVPCSSSALSALDKWQFAVRKTAHFTIYLCLGFLFTNAFFQSGVKAKKTAAVISLLCSALYAASDEFHQLFVPGRSGEFRDVCLDSAGALTGILIFILIWSVKKWTLKKQ